MSSNVPITPSSNITAPTPQNTPLSHAPIASGLSRPTVPAISEDPEVFDNDDDIDDDDEDDDNNNNGAISSSHPAVQAALQSMVQSKLATLVGKSSGYIENLPVEVKRSVEALKGIHAKQLALRKQFRYECLELEKKYLELSKPLYDRRHSITMGLSPPTQEEISSGETESVRDDPEYTPLPALPSNTPISPRSIPEFWLTALRNHLGISELITDRDADALKHLIDIRLEYLSLPPSSSPDSKSPSTGEKETGPGFKLIFEFTPNAFFENKILSKTYIYQDELGYEGDFVYDHCVGTEILWKGEKDLTREFEIKKQRNKNTNRTRLIRKSHPADSFFNFFNPPTMPSDEDIEAGNIDEEEIDDIESRLEVDYQMGEDIKERIIPNAIDFFTGKALEYEDISEEEDDDEIDLDIDDLDDDEDDDDEDDEDDDEDDDVAGARRTQTQQHRQTRRSNPNNSSSSAAAGARGNKGARGQQQQKFSAVIGAPNAKFGSGSGSGANAGAGGDQVNAEECKQQ